MAQNPYQKYKKAKYETASPEQLLLMLYNGAIKFGEQARTGLVKNNIQQANDKLKKVQAVVSELMASLNLEQGGEVAGNLYSLYEYMDRRLIQANVRKDVEILDEVLDLLTELKESWESAITQLRKNSVQNAGGLNVQG